MLKALNQVAGWMLMLAGIGGLIWFIVRSLKRSDDPPRLIVKGLVSLLIIGLLGVGITQEVGFSLGGAFIVPFVCVVIGLILSILWTPHVGGFLAKPLTSMYDGGDTECDPQPFYSIALGRRKRGQIQEAIGEIEKQLARFPQDYTGQILLAEIQAQDLHDVEAARITVERLCQQPGHSPAQIADALSQLADWQLRYQQDVDAAHATLEKICLLLPNTEQERAACQRLAHLASAESLLARHDAAPLQLRPGLDNLGLRPNTRELQPAEESPQAAVERCLHQLEQHPWDDQTREKLALIYAEHFGRLDLALDHLEQLIQKSSQPPKNVARWLNLAADLQIRHGQDLLAAQRQLERIIELYPGLAAAEQARQRLSRLKLELKGQEKSRVVQLGSYEQNLGLKMRSPPTASGEPPTPASDSPSPAG